jgi:hypothetical protein
LTQADQESLIVRVKIDEPTILVSQESLEEIFGIVDLDHFFKNLQEKIGAQWNLSNFCIWGY